MHAPILVCVFQRWPTLRCLKAACASTELYRPQFILDRHPEAENVWIVGGGSGHGFKHGPVIGEMVTDAVLGSKPPRKEMLFGRLL